VILPRFPSSSLLAAQTSCSRLRPGLPTTWRAAAVLFRALGKKGLYKRLNNA
jgi:hypothetical protein